MKEMLLRTLSVLAVRWRQTVIMTTIESLSTIMVCPSLDTLLLLVIVLCTSWAAFGGWGILVVGFCFLLMKRSLIARTRPRTVIILAVIALVSIVAVEFLRVCVLWPLDDWRPWYSCTHINLKRIGRALQEYHHVHGCFPPVHVTNSEGQPIHSWRSLIVPYLGCQSGYRLSEPWDGANNRELAGCREVVFHCPTNKSRNDTETSYLAVTGPGTAWQANRGVRLEDITDGPSQTVLIVELFGSDVHWMEPRDITLEQALDGPNGKASVPSSSHVYPGGYFFRETLLAGNMLMADGTVVGLAVSPSSKEMAALLSIKGSDNADIRQSQTPWPLVSLIRWDHIVGLPLFLITITWFWFRRRKGIAWNGKRGGTGKRTSLGCEKGTIF